MRSFKLSFSFFILSLAVCHAQTASDKNSPLSSAETSMKAGSSAEVSLTTGFTPQQKHALRIIFDDSNSQLIGIDSSGKVVENAIIAFQLFVTIKGVSHSEQALGCSLNQAMRDLLTQVEQNTILYFEHIQVMNATGNLVEAEDFQYTLSYLPKEKK